MLRLISLLPFVTKAEPSAWLRDLWDAQGFAGSSSLRWPADISFSQLLDEFVPDGSRTHFAVSIGGRTGQPSHDHVAPLFRSRAYHGVVFEEDASRAAALDRTHEAATENASASGGGSVQTAAHELAR